MQGQDDASPEQPVPGSGRGALKTVAIVFAKIVASVVLFVFCLIISFVLYEFVGGWFSPPFWSGLVLAVAVITPVWVPAPTPWRVFAAVAGATAGLATEGASLVRYTDDIGTQDLITQVLSIGSGVVGVGVCLLVLDIGRSRSAA